MAGKLPVRHEAAARGVSKPVDGGGGEQDVRCRTWAGQTGAGEQAARSR
eukprot:COSAG01_NODE_63642_length_279_cov_0.750000_1_plen_48_part_01